MSANPGVPLRADLREKVLSSGVVGDPPNRKQTRTEAPCSRNYLSKMVNVIILFVGTVYVADLLFRTLQMNGQLSVGDVEGEASHLLPSTAQLCKDLFVHGGINTTFFKNGAMVNSSVVLPPLKEGEFMLLKNSFCQLLPHRKWLPFCSCKAALTSEGRRKFSESFLKGLGSCFVTPQSTEDLTGPVPACPNGTECEVTLCRTQRDWKQFVY